MWPCKKQTQIDMDELTTRIQLDEIVKLSWIPDELMWVTVIEIGKALDNNTEWVRSCKQLHSTKRLPVLLASEMEVRKKQHKNPLDALQLSYTLASASPKHQGTDHAKRGVEWSSAWIAELVAWSWGGTEAYKNIPYPWNSHLWWGPQNWISTKQALLTNHLHFGSVAQTKGSKLQHKGRFQG